MQALHVCACVCARTLACACQIAACRQSVSWRASLRGNLSFFGCWHHHTCLIMLSKSSFVHVISPLLFVYDRSLGFRFRVILIVILETLSRKGWIHLFFILCFSFLPPNSITNCQLSFCFIVYEAFVTINRVMQLNVTVFYSTNLYLTLFIPLLRAGQNNRE